ncbi:MAG: MBL fold metallo-hydrolase [Syntrophomonadaceae bacterium]|nr:MBL fold metallo-hydrolase [Syntrophomonadaceae bacterium]
MMLFNMEERERPLRVTWLKGRTGAVLDHTNLGVWRLDDERCLLIDSSNGSARIAKIAAALEREGLKIAAVINTHGHADHCGGNAWLQANVGCPLFTSEEASLLVEYPILIPSQIFSAYPPRILTNRFVTPEASRVAGKLPPGPFVFENTEFEIISLPGHSHGHIGIRTPDDIVFTGDALITEEVLEVNRMMVILNLDEFLATLERVGELKADLFVPGHGEPFGDPARLAAVNLDFVNGMLDLLLQHCAVPRTREYLMKELIKRYGMSMNSTQYYLLLATLSACLSGLTRQKRMQLKYASEEIVFIKK